MYNQLDIGIVIKNKENEPYSYIYNISNYNCFNIKQKLINSNDDLYFMKIVNNLKKSEIIVRPTMYELQVIINKYTGNEIKYLKNSNCFKYDINVLIYVVDNTEKIVGIEYNNNRYYIKNKTKKLKDYCTAIKDKIIDKSSISEIIHNSFKYYLRNVCGYLYRHENWQLLNSFDQFYKKNFINYNLENYIDYMILYQSAVLKFEICYLPTGDIKNCTFLPVNKKSYSNLYNIYQIAFKVLENNNKSIKTFTNPKNKEWFNNNYNIIESDYILKLRLYVSKYNTTESLYYRKSSESNIYKISIMVDNKSGKIIGVSFNKIEYFIWKNNGDLNTYETFNKNNNYHEFIVNAFKDALMFLFKIY